MKQYQISYENDAVLRDRLSEIKRECEKNDHGSAVFYLTWTESARGHIGAAASAIEDFFPDSDYYGNEASGNISEGEFTFGINISCCVFEDASSRTELLWVEQGTELSSLEELWSFCEKQEGLRAVELIPSMSYVSALSIDGSVPTLGSDIVIFGGASVNYDNATFDAGVMAKGHPVTNDGMAVLLYFGESLNYFECSILGWKGLGRLMEVTDSTGKCIREIDGSPAYSIYEKYLNLTTDDKDTLVFPLIVEEDGDEFIRTPQIILPDKSMQMFADIPRGTKVRISYGDKNTILNGINEKAKEIADFRPQVIKAYSCAARRLFWGDSEVGKETGPLQTIAPVCGFYTGGEILRFGNKLRVLNQTLAIVAFREGEGAANASAAGFGRIEDKSLISRLTYFSEKIVEEEKAHRLLAEGLETALSSEYQVMYYINLEEGNATFLHGDDEARKFIPIFNTNSAEEMFSNFHKYYVDAAVVDEDRLKVKEVMNAENVLKTLKTRSSMSVNYRIRRNSVDPVYMEMRIIKAGESGGAVSSVVLAFRFTDEELRNALDLNKKLQADIMEEMLSDDGVFLIDCVKDKRSTVHDKLHGADHYSDNDSYSYSFTKYVETYVAEGDRERMIKYAFPEYLFDCLEHSKEYTVEYRDITTGSPLYFEMKVMRFSDTEVLQSFAEKDKEILERIMVNKLIDEYDALYVVDLDLDEIRPARSSRVSEVGAFGDKRVYSEICLQFAETVDPQYRQDWINFSDVGYMRKYMSDEDHREYAYELPGLKKTMRRFSVDVIERAEGAAKVLLLSFVGIDDYRAQTMFLQKKMSERTKGFAGQYSVLYFVNLNTLETENYYLNDRSTPDEAKAIDKSSENFFEAFKKSMVVYAHPDYREELLKYAEPAYVKDILKDRRRHEFRFLCLDATGEYAWTDMVLMKFSDNENDDPENIAIGYYSIDAEMRERLETFRRTERDLEAIRGLAEEFDTLHFVDLDNDSYSLYYLISDSPDEAKEMAEENMSFSEFHRASMKAFCHPDYLDEMLRFADADYIRQVLESGNKYTRRFLCNSDDGYKWCEFALIRLDKEESPKRVAMGYTNINDMVVKEQAQQQALTDALAAAESASHAKTEFLFSMSHDIRTPMNAILGYTDIALRHLDEPERVGDSLKKIKTSGGHLLSLINDILEMSRIEAGKLEIVEAPVDLMAAAESINYMSRALAVTKDISFKTVVGEIGNRYVYADELHINQILINLISNAIKYTNPGGNVEYRVDQIGNAVNGIAKYRMTISDNGIGMSEEFQKHLFENFSRENTATVSKQEGAGLGLAIVKRITDLSGGTISVKSRKDEGSTFVVELPLRVMDDEAIRAYESEHSANAVIEEDVSLEGKTVLLVEDNEMNREIAAELLREAGLAVETSEDGAIAVKTVAEKGAEHFDFILMDIQMPVMDGYEATAEIRRLPGGESVPIIALSANAFKEDVDKSIAAGMNAHIAKPIDVKVLLGTLHSFLQ